ncbi:DNA recombination protein RmuC [Actinomyces ruminis]|uniref:DNA recombination protein RmuC n=1 Tax=Actinomyces ruminis TaxID=1937003 RepID=A0ABX4MDN4_9ACTO|nr:DNA recombination protein RmuC [Actinomyces ruminis]PHP53609.1 DNA recombination protein RmuC [Actinomyces ruminis]
MSTALPILLLLIGLLVGAVSGYALAVAARLLPAPAAAMRSPPCALRAAQWRARAEELTARTAAAEERAERDGSVLRALAPVRSQLEQVGARVEQMEQQRAAEHATLTEQLRAGAESDRELRRTTTALEGALRSRSSRGVWGEVELARVLEASGMMRHIDFSEQRSVAAVVGRRNGASGTSANPKSRPDVVVHLPGDGFLALDAKVPLDSYLRACAVEADPDGAAPAMAASPGRPSPEGRAPGGPAPQELRARLLAKHAKALRAHVDALADRHYARTLQDSPELVVLFVPAEPILAAALEADPTLMEHALDRGVALTTPASLLALLRTCATAWARTAVNDDARELVELGRTLYERLGTVAKHLDALGAALTRSVIAYNQAVGSIESRLLVTARSFETFGDGLAAPQPVPPDHAQVRRFASAELTTPSE